MSEYASQDDDTSSAILLPAEGERESADRVLYRIDNMDCPTEEALIRAKLARVPGVAGLDFNLVQRTLGVTHTLSSSQPIEAALAAIGMKAIREAPASASHTTVLGIPQMDCPTEERSEERRVGKERHTQR